MAARALRARGGVRALGDGRHGVAGCGHLGGGVRDCRRPRAARPSCWRPPSSLPRRWPTLSEQFPGLAGVVPGGRYDPNPWGLGFELKGEGTPLDRTRRSPPPSGTSAAPGTFLWVDPDARLACVVLTDRPCRRLGAALWAALSAEGGGGLDGVPSSHMAQGSAGRRASNTLPPLDPAPTTGTAVETRRGARSRAADRRLRNGRSRTGRHDLLRQEVGVAEAVGRQAGRGLGRPGQQPAAGHDPAEPQVGRWRRPGRRRGWRGRCPAASRWRPAERRARRRGGRRSRPGRPPRSTAPRPSRDLGLEVGHDPAGPHRELAADQVHGLDAVGALVDRGDADVAEVLGDARLLDVAHAAVHLDRQRRDLDAEVGAPTLGQRREQVGQLGLARCGPPRRGGTWPGRCTRR